MSRSFIFLKRWPLCCLLFFAFACHLQKEDVKIISSQNDSLLREKRIDSAFIQIDQSKKLIVSGDLILRTGKDFTSDAMKSLSLHDKTYSHCGIASWENDTLFVYHALGGDFNPNQKIRRDTFEMFCNPYENKGFGIFKYKINKYQQEKVIQIAKQFYSAGVMFDMKFDLTTDDRMYCSEYVFKTVERATSHAVLFPTTTLNGIQFVAIDNLFYNSYCKEVKRIVFP